MERINLTTKATKDYELIDSGMGEKLERFGEVVLARPDPQALWPKGRGAEWQKAQGRFEREGKDGRWTGKLPKEWKLEYRGLTFLIRPTSFKHTGIFPEQFGNWEWTEDLLAKAKNPEGGFRARRRENLSESSAEDSRTPRGVALQEPNILNLFGYTGGATLAAAAAGASVTHVDASKTAVAWARENAKLSGLEEKPVRWIVEDAMKFVKRELSRGVKYDGIIMDPPAFGHGPKDELWKIEEDFIEMVKLCQQLLSEKPLFFLINGYAAGYSPLAFAYNLEPLVQKFGGSIEYGELTISESGSERLLPAGIFVRWSAGK